MTLPRKYSQNDLRWKNVLLGFNTDPKYTIGSQGCLITCLAMASCYYGFENTPLEINDKLKKVQGFVDGGKYVWNSIEKVINIQENFFRTPTLLTDIQVEDIRNQLDAGYPVMLEIDAIPSTSGLDMHFVLATGYNPADENDISIVDPWDGSTKSLKAYLGWFKPTMRKTIEGYSVLIGGLPEASVLRDTLITWDDGEGKRHNVGWYVYEWFLEKQRATKEALAREELEDNYENYKDKVNKIIEEKDNSYNEAIVSFNKQIDTRDTTIAKHIKTIETLEKKVVSLEEQLTKEHEYTIEESASLLIGALKRYAESLIEKMKGGER